jgi:nitrite reductase (NO-forming)
MSMFKGRDGRSFLLISLIVLGVLAVGIVTGAGLLRSRSVEAETTAMEPLRAGATPTRAGVSQAAASTGATGSEPSPRVQVQTGSSDVNLVPDVTFTLKSAVGEAGLLFVGVGGAIEGQINPTLRVAEGAVVQVTLINEDGALHDVVFPEFNAATEQVLGKGSSSTTVFRASTGGQYDYYCSVPGHRQAGMVGLLVVGEGVEVVEDTGANIVADPAELPAPIGRRGPQRLSIELETTEVKGQLADGTTYNYWTFNGQVPGPMLRVRVGDTVDVRLRNSGDSRMTHSVDFHAVTGPGGGAAVTQAAPGEEKVFSFQALNPGLYVYHCATPMVAHHVTNGMYGLILVEPENGLPPVDREFYIMQGELYTQAAYGQHGNQEFSVEKLMNEQAEYVLFNGAVGALTKAHPLQANVGETVRIFFGVGGPNYTSSFHVIGEIFDRVYDQASLTSRPLTDVQTTLVPAGGATMVEFKLDVPGRYILVDHALARMERGLVGFLDAEGEANPSVFDAPAGAGNSGGH